MRIKRALMLLLGIAIVIIVIFSGALPTSEPASDGDVKNAQAIQSSADSTTAPTGKSIVNISDVPMYPQSTKVDEGCNGELQDQCHYRLLAPGSVENAVKFYTKSVGEWGWVLALTSYTTTNTTNLDFTHMDMSGDTPLRRYINVYIIPEENRANDLTIDVHFERWPDPITVPIIDGAMQVMTSWQLDGIHHVRVTEYLVQVPLADILDYYEVEMSRLGWVPGNDDTEPGGVTKSLRTFRYSRVSKEVRILGSYVKIDINATSSGQLVKLEAGGSDVEAQFDIEHR